MKFERLKPSVYADGFSSYTVKFVLSFWVPLWLVRCFLLESGVLPTEAVDDYGELAMKRGLYENYRSALVREILGDILRSSTRSNR